MKERIAELEQEIHERQAVEAEQEERIAALLGISRHLRSRVRRLPGLPKI